MKNFNEEMKKAVIKGVEMLEGLGIDKAEDDYVIIQPFNNSQAISIRFEGKGSDRKSKVEITDTMVVLPKINDVLNVFKGSKI